MGRQLFLSALLTCVSLNAGLTQDKLSVKDKDGNLLMAVNDEGTFGSISLSAGTAQPSVTTKRLYNIGGTLFFDGTPLLV